MVTLAGMHLFVLDLTYLAGLDAVEAHMGAHREFLREQYAAGTLLASGRKEPRTGGVLLARGTREQAEAIAAADPFTVQGVAQYRITEFVPTMTAPELESVREAPAG